MEKRFQIFISSTFSDLVEERQGVLKAILEIDHMPAGMELFPASDDSAWDLIKDVIDASDYYVIVIGGRYGSVDEEGISYTEKEYEYAYSAGKPVIPILHKNPDNLSRGKTETEDKTWDKLQDFISKVEERHTCKYWETAEDLKAKVIVSLTAEIKKKPAVGWVRADQVPSEATMANFYELKDRVNELEEELEKSRSTAPAGTEELMQGDDTIDLEIKFDAKPDDGTYYDKVTYKATISPTWNELFAGISPVLINEASEFKLKKYFRDYLSDISLNEYTEHDDLQNYQLSNFRFNDSELDTCLVQLRALGLIEESKKKRSVKDTSTYWTLTSYGDKQMVQLRAIRKKPLHAKSIGSATEKVSD